MTGKKIILVFIVIAFLSGVVFVGYSLYMNVQPKEMVELIAEDPSLPTISFVVNGYKVNELLAYKREMDISAARENLTPLDPQGKINMVINQYGNTIDRVTYTVSTLDGNTILHSDEVAVENEGISLSLGIAATAIVESMLNIKLEVNGEELNYYTRIIAYDQLMLEENLSFIEGVHNATLDPQKWDYLDEIIDSLAETGDIDLANVNLQSSIDEIQWGGLKGNVIGEVRWRISEASAVYTGVELSYLLQVESENKLDYFMVEEYFRTSYSSSKEEVQLSDYQRTAAQLYQADEKDLDYKKLNLAVAGNGFEFIQSEDENIVVFAQAKELYSYNSKENCLVKVYGDDSWFTKVEPDARDFINQYDVRALDVDADGNISFIVYGYVKSGENEGLVGTSIYFYDANECITQEKAFICGDKSFAQSKEELAQNAYYNTENQEVYILVNQIIYAINLVTLEERQISQRLHQGEYVFSEDKDYIAFNNGEGDILSSLTVLSVETGEEYKVDAKDEGNVYPLGFVGYDLVIGYANKEDAGMNYRGEEITPAYEVEVRDESNKVIKTYSKDNHYVEDVTVEDKVLYLNQLTVKDGVYNMAGSEYIANNVSTQESSIAESDGTDEQYGKVKSITLKNTSTKTWAYKQATLMENEGKIIIAYESYSDDQVYYVHAYGKLYKSCKSLAEAIALADAHYGYVLNNNQGYSWRRGARALNYAAITSANEMKSKLKDGMGVVELVQSYSPNNLQNYTGLNLETMCYLINQDQIIAVKFNAGNWVVLTGYTTDTIYYLDETGAKGSEDINKLSSQVDTIIGNSNLY